jgi:hypothetical protein
MLLESWMYDGLESDSSDCDAVPEKEPVSLVVLA